MANSKYSAVKLVNNKDTLFRPLGMSWLTYSNKSTIQHFFPGIKLFLLIFSSVQVILLGIEVFSFFGSIVAAFVRKCGVLLTRKSSLEDQYNAVFVFFVLKV